ncbi:SAM-dependent methyltransferase [Rubrivivax albus]|uniref:Ribosomal RNA small subunit methyltransferase I n=1 Tax=Rubrivivax albus TaxID=2499835 RepID=A0A437JRF7_9BURK|nr:SAM-dependent methyltransferase [Rubrivivax albus]RVT49449.1 ribosomal RNA small subunit methyltransferase I [Rubrivivax albus]
MSRGTLFLVPNTLDLGLPPAPVDDVLPAVVLRTAARLHHWAAEDAKTARAFLKRVDALVPLAAPLQQLSIVELPRPRKGSREPVPGAAWQALLAPALAGEDIGLISEAGLPAIADPGAALVAAAHAAGVPVHPLVGPSALMLALAASGLEGQSFAFVGYPPQDPTARAARLRELEALSRRHRQTQLMIETPYRNEALLQALLEVLAPETWLSVSAGLTTAAAFTRSAAVSAWRQAPSTLPLRVPAVFALLAR